jgi:hypothetical protein
MKRTFDPEKLLRTLAEHEVDFYVIGAVAAWLHGNPTATVDLDVMPRRDLDNADRLAAALNALNARRHGSDTMLELEGADFFGWQSQSFDTEAGPLDVVPQAQGRSAAMRRWRQSSLPWATSPSVRSRSTR